jgi:hypothetical protein
MENIEKIFEELVQFIEISNDAQILLKMPDITSFLGKSFTDLDILTKNQVQQKGDIYLDPNFKPLSLNVRKALEIVKKFEMQWPALERKPIKFLGTGEIAGDIDDIHPKTMKSGKNISPKKVTMQEDEDFGRSGMPPLPTGAGMQKRGH